MLSVFSFLGFLLFLPQQVEAYACEDPAILALAPISSHYTQQVLNRAEAGIQNAQSTLPGFDPNTNYLFWLTKMGVAMNSLLDTKLRITAQERDLDLTACMHLDLALIEAEMQRVRCKMQEAYSQGSSVGILKLQDLLTFLNERYESLFRGGLDPLYVDEGWQIPRSFDPDQSVWCCANIGNACELYDSAQACTRLAFGRSYAGEASCMNFCCPGCNGVIPVIETPEALCPFHSDYLPPTNAGLGCTLDVLLPYKGGPNVSTNEEIAGLEAFMDWRDDFLAEIANTINNTSSIVGAPSAAISSFATIPRKVVFGCEARHEPNGQVTTGPVDPNIIYALGGTKAALRGPFSYEKNQLGILENLLSLKQHWGIERKIPTSPTVTLWEETSEGKKAYQEFTTAQGAAEAAFIAKGTDATYQIRNVFSAQLRKAMFQFAKLASEKGTSVRGFAIDYTFFLRRSCLYRPCNEKLDTLLKILESDNCFPYTSGDYLYSGNAHEACKIDAGL